MLCFRSQSYLKIKVKTWRKDIRELFDYHSDQLSKDKFQVTMPSVIWWTRKSIEMNYKAATSEVEQSEDVDIPKDGYVETHKGKKYLLGFIEPSTKKAKQKNFSFYPCLRYLDEQDQNIIEGITEKITERITERISDKLTKIPEGSSLSKQSTNSLYIVVKEYQNKEEVLGYKLSTRDFIRIGIVNFSVLQICTWQNRNLKKVKQQRQSETSFFDTSSFYDVSNQNQDIYQVKGVAEGSCKFCFLDQQTFENPLISPCHCKGSCSTIHLNCLKEWINAKVKRERHGLVTSLNFTKFECEICKQAYPTFISCNGKKCSLIQISRPSTPYLVLQAVRTKTKPNSAVSGYKCIHIITPLESSQIKIGRAEECEIHVDDKTVSRLHSKIRYQKGSFYIQDNDSKFGTLVKLQKPQHIRKKLTVQIGRSVFDLIPK